jgi:hypothetical protein
VRFETELTTMVGEGVEPKMKRDFLSTMCVHSLAMWASHNDFKVVYYTSSRFLISSTHHIDSAPSSLIDLW